MPVPPSTTVSSGISPFIIIIPEDIGAYKLVCGNTKNIDTVSLAIYIIYTDICAPSTINFKP